MAEVSESASSFLVNELRRSRSAAGLSQEDLGKAINYSSSLVSAVENGQRPPTRDYLAGVDRALDTGGLFQRLLDNLVRTDQSPVWFRDWLVFEREATLVRWFDPSIVPGLLQTEDYARAIFAGSRLIDDEEVERRVVARLERQEVLRAPRPPHLLAIIDEGTLRRPVGSPETMAAQCEHLLRCADRSTIQINVVPAAAGAYAGLAGPFVISKGDEFEVAMMDTPWPVQVLHRRDAVDSLIKRWEAIRGEALPRMQSIGLIKEVLARWQT
ncbi:helix-turn-helix protein [Krasilnikovia cinnamomea]|uniref:Helix-turn-helix protein n=1 Tax=Krasilnikovia cinnamomea TaxID=349313 RepID=A0A4Q7ZNZ0_9ACTN|nr:helix-turn-helix transcriptional regulator [Krasilnikovia cinnamomea]RZU52115.1 helix-turn-helix protein [Krasilnikovia cinnamomea]